MLFAFLTLQIKIRRTDTTKGRSQTRELSESVANSVPHLSRQPVSYSTM
jgi:hypothetical protein